MPGQSKKGGGLQIEKYAFKMEDPSKKTQRLRERVQKTRKKHLESEPGSKKDERLYNKDIRLTDKLRASRAKDDSAFKMEDLSGDGKVTQKDVLIGKGVLNKDGSKANAMNPKGYQMNYKMVNKEGFKMAGNPAYKLDPTTDPNLSLINDPSKLSGLDISKGDNVNYQGENMNVLGIDINKIFKPEIGADDSYDGSGGYASNEDWKKFYNSPAGADYASKYTIDGKGKPTGNNVLDSFNAVVNLGSIPQPGTPGDKFDAFSSYDKRQRRRGILFEDNAIKRAESKLGRTNARTEYLDTKRKNVADIASARKNKKDKLKQIKNTDFNAIATASDLLSGQKGLSGKQLERAAKKQARKDYRATRNTAVENIAKGLKDKKQKSKDSRLNAKASANQSTVDRLKAARNLSIMQDNQGINPTQGKKSRVEFGKNLQSATAGSSTTSALPNVKEIFQSDKVKILKNKLATGAGNEMKPMQLSPKAINYFNKKNKR